MTEANQIDDAVRRNLSSFGERRDFYVYGYFRETGQIIWIGKGHGDRINWIFRRNRIRNGHLANVIIKTLAVVGDIPRVILANSLTESEAFILEITLIKIIGRHPDGPLLNMTDGGEGASGLKMTEEQRRNVSEAVKDVWETLSKEERRERTKNFTIRGTKRPREEVERRAEKLRNVPKTLEHNAKVSMALQALPPGWNRKAIDASHTDEVQNRRTETLNSKSVKEKLSVARVSSWANPIHRNNRIEGMKRAWKIKRDSILEKRRITRSKRD